MKTDDALGRILDSFQRLEKRLQAIEGRLHEEQEAEPAEQAPAPAAAEPPALKQRYEGEEREDPFAPAVRRASQARHQSAVNKALSMLGLVPDPAEEQAKRKAQTAQHQAAIQKALNVLRVAPQPEQEEDAEQAKQQSAKHQAAIGKALQALRQSAASSEPAPAEPPGVDETPEDLAGELAELSDELSELSDELADELSDDTPTDVLVDELAAATDESLMGAFDEPRDETSSAVLEEKLEETAEAVPEVLDEAPGDAAAELSEAALDETTDETSLEALNEALELKEHEVDQLLNARVLEELADEVDEAEATIPLPDLDFLDTTAGAEADRDRSLSVDLDTALDIDLERPRTGARDYAVAILNALVLLGAAAAALYAAGIFRADGIARESWQEIGVGAAAVLTGAFGLFALRLSIHLRGALAGASALLLHALLLMLLAPRMPLDPLLVAGACALTSALGAGLVLQMGHPLALFLGFGVALGLPPMMGLSPELFLPYAVAVNLATGLCAFRLHRLQASVAAAIVTTAFLMSTRHAVPAAYGALLTLLYLGQVLVAPFRVRGQTRAAAVLTVPALLFAGWTVHVLFDGPGWIKVGSLFAASTVLGFVALQLTRRQELIRGVLKAAAVLLLLSALPAGLSTDSLAPFAIFLSLLFGVFALSLYDAYLRAVGSLTLVIAVGLIMRDPSAPLLFAAAVSATVLCAVTTKTSNPRSLQLLLGAIAHGTLLYGVARLMPAEWVAYVWLALALAYQAVSRRWKLLYLEAGAVATAGTAAVWVCLALPADPLRYLITGVALLPHFRLLDRARGPWAPDLFLLLGEVLGLAALTVWLPGPVGLLAALGFLGLHYVPYEPQQEILRRHAHLLALALLARCFLADITQWPVEQRWLNPRFLSMFLCAVPALVNVRLAREARAVAAALAGAVVGLAVLLETGAWGAALVAWGAVMGTGYVIATVGRESRPVRRSSAGAKAEEADAESEADEESLRSDDAALPTA